MTCEICGNKAETRLGACWKCAEAESIIAEGLDMRDKGLGGKNGIPAKTAMEKLKLLIQKGWK